MAQTPVHHITKRKHHKPSHIFDRFMYGVAFISPIMTLPQLYQVWILKQTTGVSLLTWGAYSFVSALWLTYGMHQKDKPLVLTQLLLLILDSFIVIGTVKW